MGEKFPGKVGNNVYPRPEYRYPDAKISLTYKDSVADFPKPLQAPDGAPNILLVILDDVGFGWPSVFGGLVEMPTAERLANDGLLYLKVIQESGQVCGKLGDLNFGGIAEGLGFAMRPAVEGQEANLRRRLKQAKGLLDVAPQTVLKDKRKTIPSAIAIIKLDAIILKCGHQPPPSSRFRKN